LDDGGREREDVGPSEEITQVLLRRCARRVIPIDHQLTLGRLADARPHSGSRVVRQSYWRGPSDV